MNKELTPLQALERIKNAPTIYVGCGSDIYTRYSYECKLIENALKSLDIIKEKLPPLMRSALLDYCNKEEYDLLKEVLWWQIKHFH